MPGMTEDRRKGLTSGTSRAKFFIPYPKVQALHTSHSSDPVPSKPPETLEALRSPLLIDCFS